MTHSVRYQPIEHAYCLSYRFLNNVITTTAIGMVEMVEILDGRLGKRSVERIRYVINNLFYSYFVFPLAFWLVTILSLLVKYLVILHADPCNKSYMSSKKIVIERTRDLIYLKFEATDFSQKISSPGVVAIWGPPRYGDPHAHFTSDLGMGVPISLE